MSADPDGREEWEPMPHSLAMAAIAKAGHFTLHLVQGTPRVLVWRKIIKHKGDVNRLDKRWTTLEELPNATKAKFQEALFTHNALSGK
jgi:hypothetical protein